MLERGLITTIAWGLGDRVEYALESSMFVTGAAVQWLRDGLGVIESAPDTEAPARSLDGNDGVYFVAALTGLGSATLGSIRARHDCRSDPLEHGRPSRARHA